jgi:hypothetical protein
MNIMLSTFCRPARRTPCKVQTQAARRFLVTQSAAAVRPIELENVQSQPESTNQDFDPPSNPQGVTGILSNWVHGVQLSDLPFDVVERTKYILLDGIGCALVAAQLPWSRVATKSVLKMEGPGNCTVIGWGRNNVCEPLCFSSYLSAWLYVPRD